MTPRDPVADSLALVRNQAYHQGVADGRRWAARGSFVRGIVAGGLGALLLVSALVAYAQPVPTAAEQYRRDLVRSAQSAFGLGAPVATLAAQVHQESGWRPGVTSWAGAQGLSQFMPATAAGLARQYPELQPVNAFDPRWSLRAQSLLMRDLVRQFGPHGANECEIWCYAMTAYNGGPRWVLRRIDGSPTPRRCLGATSLINPGIRPSAQAENQGYPVRILLRLEPVYAAAGWGRGVCPHYAIGG